MAQILTFLGQSRTDCAVVTVAAARQLAHGGKRVLWLTQDDGPLPSQLWGQALTGQPQAIATNLWGMQLRATELLEKNWDLVKALEAQYLRSPLLKQVYGQELVVLPGMDEALALNAVRELYGSGQYDIIVLDGRDGRSLLRMWDLPNGLDWYIRRFQAVIQASDLARALTPFIQPVAAAILNIGGTQEEMEKPVGQARSLLEAGRDALHNPQQVLGFLVTGRDRFGATTAHHLWGSAQQVGLTIGGVIAVGVETVAPLEAQFAPLVVHYVPALVDDQWEPLMAALPNWDLAAQTSPRSVTVDEAARQVKLFLPGFQKDQITLTQYGPEVTISAGDQRRNLDLPDSLRNRSITGAKFQDHYLILSF
ncbi:MAG: ArsA family ATPase [Leptolyngbyaceae cyanobacterium T60_A2020_046]|nr:ArsA family ATPase [Leptolyngbyaceae cyanobacterium T60_A2020_046]